jgi:hypothetical protein
MVQVCSAPLHKVCGISPARQSSVLPSLSSFLKLVAYSEEIEVAVWFISGQSGIRFSLEQGPWQLPPSTPAGQNPIHHF